MSAPRPLPRRLVEPLSLALLTIAGLVASLTCSGALKALGVGAVALPLLAVIRHAVRHRSSFEDTPS